MFLKLNTNWINFLYSENNLFLYKTRSIESFIDEKIDLYLS